MTKIKNFFLANVMLVLIFFSSCAVNSSQPTISLTTTPTSAQPTYQGKTITVTSRADSGPGTLRQALLDAENGDFINFDDKIFPPTNPTTIYVNSELPLISQGDITVDASNAGVILNGSTFQQVGGTLDYRWSQMGILFVGCRLSIFLVPESQ